MNFRADSSELYWVKASFCLKIIFQTYRHRWEDCSFYFLRILRRFPEVWRKHKRTENDLVWDRECGQKLYGEFVSQRWSCAQFWNVWGLNRSSIESNSLELASSNGRYGDRGDICNHKKLTSMILFYLCQRFCLCFYSGTFNQNFPIKNLRDPYRFPTLELKVQHLNYRFSRRTLIRKNGGSFRRSSLATVCPIQWSYPNPVHDRHCVLSNYARS